MKWKMQKYSNSWTKGEFAFNGATLEEIAKELSRMYNMEIKFDSDEIKEYPQIRNL